MKKQRYVAEMVVRVLDENRYGNPEYDYCDIVEADSPDEALEKWIAIETEGGNLNTCDVKENGTGVHMPRICGVRVHVVRRVQNTAAGHHA